ncbi:hypothetical protein BDZ97DRAFT_2060557 [Flammula alnicola]|nr:hypothetical protein BDZ97DRAFT_2060557 [Flammula alnicola]
MALPKNHLPFYTLANSYTLCQFIHKIYAALINLIFIGNAWAGRATDSAVVNGSQAAQAQAQETYWDFKLDSRTLPYFSEDVEVAMAERRCRELMFLSIGRDLQGLKLKGIRTEVHLPSVFHPPSFTLAQRVHLLTIYQMLLEVCRLYGTSSLFDGLYSTTFMTTEITSTAKCGTIDSVEPKAVDLMTEISSSKTVEQLKDCCFWQTELWSRYTGITTQTPHSHHLQCLEWEEGSVGCPAKLKLRSGKLVTEHQMPKSCRGAPANATPANTSSDERRCVKSLDDTDEEHNLPQNLAVGMHRAIGSIVAQLAALQSVQCVIKFFNEQVLAVSDVEDPAVAEAAESDIARLKVQRTTKHTRCKD